MEKESLSFRRVLFWLHLAAGVVAGLIVAMMSITGAALAFEPQLREWAERETRTVVPTGTRLATDELLRKVEAAHPGKAITAIAIPAEPTHAIRVSLGREEGVHVDPYTGEVRALGGHGARAAFGALIRWHRYLGAEGEGRDTGRAITGAGNAAFFFLAFSGLVLWWPRRWTRSALRPVLWFKRGLGARPRDFNWHNVIGFWSLPALVVITFSGLMISYKPVTNFIYATFGEKPPAAGPGGAAAVKVPAPPPGATRVPLEGLLATARQTVPDWTSLVVRMPARGAGTQAVTVAVKAPAAGPRFSSVQLSFDPFTGALLKDERFAGYTTGRKVRSWLRFLHTGEALGWPGQLVAGLVSLGAVVLVYTGFAMALRRLRTWLRARATRAGAKAENPAMSATAS